MATKNNKEINLNTMLAIKPITDNQKVVFNSWKKGKNRQIWNTYQKKTIQVNTKKTLIESFKYNYSINFNLEKN